MPLLALTITWTQKYVSLSDFWSGPLMFFHGRMIQEVSTMAYQQLSWTIGNLHFTKCFVHSTCWPFTLSQIRGITTSWAIYRSQSGQFPSSQHLNSMSFDAASGIVSTSFGALCSRLRWSSTTTWKYYVDRFHIQQSVKYTVALQWLYIYIYIHFFVADILTISAARSS